MVLFCTFKVAPHSVMTTHTFRMKAKSNLCMLKGTCQGFQLFDAVHTNRKADSEFCGMVMHIFLFSDSHKVAQFVLSHGQTQVLTGCHLSAVDISLEEGN